MDELNDTPNQNDVTPRTIGEVLAESGFEREEPDAEFEAEDSTTGEED